MSNRHQWLFNLETAQQECRLCIDKWRILMTRVQNIVEEHEEYTPEAFKASILELMPEFARIANAAAARLQIMVQLKCGEMKFHGGKPEEFGN
jgi:hypothetical protein